MKVEVEITVLAILIIVGLFEVARNDHKKRYLIMAEQNNACMEAVRTKIAPLEATESDMHSFGARHGSWGDPFCALANSNRQIAMFKKWLTGEYEEKNNKCSSGAGDVIGGLYVGKAMGIIK